MKEFYYFYIFNIYTNNKSNYNNKTLFYNIKNNKKIGLNNN